MHPSRQGDGQDLWVLVPAGIHVVELQGTLGQGRAWLMAAHLRRDAALADRLLVLRNGRLEGEFRRGSEGFEAALSAQIAALTG